MKLSIKRYSLLLLTFGLFTFGSCKKEPPVEDFDRKEMLANIGNNIIVPEYAAMAENVNDLQIAANTFTVNPAQNTLEALQNEFKEAYLQWQRVSVYEFGPAEQVVLRSNMNIFPTDTAKIENNITSGSYDLGTASNLTAKGFPALDYLLFSGSQTEIINEFSSTARQTYLKDIISNMKSLVDNVHQQWISTGGNYINTFKNATGTDVGSSLGMLINQFNYEYELVKNAKIGIPVGKKTLGIPQPKKVEAYYSGISVELAVENLEALERLYLGIGKNGADGTSLDEYLVHLNAKHNNQLLSDAIKAQFDVVLNTVAAMPSPLSDAVVNNPQPVNEAYLEIQKMVVLIKTDMPSAMGVLITYQDNDGD